ncbi:MAG TPA: MBL fold metallo-hydrolase [Solirubrobacteraceae bacterium]|nr:MBL fold metallo-hydrolase [Solirubrobacteraceae bacterium]
MNARSRVVHHLGCGTMCPHGERLINGEGSLLGPARLICHCLLVERADGLVLIDTGFGLDDMRNTRQLGRIFDTLFRPQAREAETAIEQVRALGFQPQDVREIVATHLDVDHAGGLPDFPDANVHVLSRELHAALHPSLRERERYVSVHWAHGPKWVEHDAGGDDWFGFQSVRILPGSDPEIALVPLFGHTRGHTGVAVKDGDRWLLHCGDAFFHRGELETPPRCPPALKAFQNLNSVENGARRSNSERLRELAQRSAGEVELLCSHDPVMLERLQAAS